MANLTALDEVSDTKKCPHPTQYVRDMFGQPQPWGSCLLCERDEWRNEANQLRMERAKYRTLAGIGLTGTDEADELAKLEPMECEREAYRRIQMRGLLQMRAVADQVRLNVQRDSQSTALPSKEQLTVDQAVGMLLKTAGYVLSTEKADKLVAYIQELDRLAFPAETKAEQMDGATIALVLDWAMNEEGWRPEHPAGMWNSKFEKMAKAVYAEWTAMESVPKSEPKPICPTCKTELAWEGDVCGLCFPVAQP